MAVHCPYCQDDVDPNPNSVHCPDCGNPIPALKEQADAGQPAPGTPADPAAEGVASPQSPEREQTDEGEVDESAADETTCPACGKSVEADWVACPYCEADLTGPEPEEEAADEVPEACPECGFEPLDPEMSICPQCQTSIGGETGPDAEPAAAHPADTGGPSGAEEIVLDFDVGGSLVVEDGDALGTELRQHLHDNGVDTQEAMRISRQHVLFKQQGEDVHVVDLESTNGTVLNGERLDPNREYPVADGDTLELGDVAEVTVHVR